MSENKIERRNALIRAGAQGDEMALVGRAVGYNDVSSTEIFPGLRERVLPGAFAASLRSGQDVKATVGHDDKGLPLGRLKNGTLKLTDTDSGLDFRVQLDPNISSHRDAWQAVKSGLISQCSFAFRCDDEFFSEGFARDGSPCQIRNIRSATLFDVAVVQNPFYGDAGGGEPTNVDARSAARKRNELLAKVQAMPATWAQQERAARLGLQIAKEK